MHLIELIDTLPVVAVNIGKAVRHGKSRILYISAVKVCGWAAYNGHKFDRINDVGRFYRRICFRRMSCTRGLVFLREIRNAAKTVRRRKRFNPCKPARTVRRLFVAVRGGGGQVAKRVISVGKRGEPRWRMRKV